MMKNKCFTISQLKQWRSQPKNVGREKNLGVAKMFDFRRITLFCLDKRLSKHNMTAFQQFGGAWPPWLPLATPMSENVYNE